MRAVRESLSPSYHVVGGVFWGGCCRGFEEDGFECLCRMREGGGQVFGGCFSEEGFGCGVDGVEDTGRRHGCEWVGANG